MDNIVIKKLHTNEVDIINEIEKNQNIHIISKDTIINDLKNNQILYYTLKLKSKIIGYISFNVVLENMDIHSIVIDKNYQKKGYGTYLLNFALKYAKDNDVNNIFLEVRKSNTKAINLYKKIGFDFINTRKRYYPDNFEDALIYSKKI